MQVARHWDQTQADGFSGRKQQRAWVRIVLLPPEELLNWHMREVSCREDVGYVGADLCGNAPALGQVSLDKSAMFPG
jgi:hypothetical protein